MQGFSTKKGQRKLIVCSLGAYMDGDLAILWYQEEEEGKGDSAISGKYHRK